MSTIEIVNVRQTVEILNEATIEVVKQIVNIIELGTQGPAGLGGDMNKAAYDTNNDGIVNQADVITNQGDLATLDEADLDKYTQSEVNTLLDDKLSIASIVNNLTSTAIDQPLSAAQGKVLRDLIESINTLLLSDTTTLDTIQEIVDFIEINRETLDALSIASIAGLETALANLQTQINSKADASHTHTLSQLLQSGATPNQVAQWNGVQWVPATIEGVSGSTAPRAVCFDFKNPVEGDIIQITTYAPFTGTINIIENAYTDSGTIDITVYINSTPVGGMTGETITATESDISPTTDNAFVDGDKISIELSNVATNRVVGTLLISES